MLTMAALALALAADPPGVPPAAPAPAQAAPRRRSESRIRLAYYRPAVYVGGGDFKGTALLVGPEWAIGLPRIDQTSEGFGLEVGVSEPAGTVGTLRYQRTRHPTPSLGAGSTATLTQLSLYGQSCTRTRLRVQACLDYGLIVYSHLDIERDAVNAEGGIGAAHYRDGTGAILGASTQVFLADRVSLQLGVAWQGIWYGKGGAFGDEPLELEESAALRALALHLGIAVDL